MAYDVQFSIPTRTLGRADVEFQVKDASTTLGTLTVSKGSVVWFPSSTTIGYRLHWKRFAELMEAHATSVERR